VSENGGDGCLAQGIDQLPDSFPGGLSNAGSTPVVIASCEKRRPPVLLADGVAEAQVSKPHSPWWPQFRFIRLLLHHLS